MEEPASLNVVEMLPEIKPVRFTWSYYRECVRICKTYDFSAGTWRPFWPAGQLASAAA